jgi:DNA-directed RNA polymerase specialized sigma24 family protein
VRVLCGRQVPPADAEDIVQEVAVRALAHPQDFATREDLARWCWRVTWRLRIDAVRKTRRVATTECPDVPATEDTVRLVEGRLALEAALAGVTSLSPRDRSALFAVASPDASRQETVRLAVRRHRARARLRRALGGGFVVAGLAWLDLVLRRLRPRARLALAGPVVLVVAIQAGSLLLAPTTRPANAGGVMRATSTTLEQPAARPHVTSAASPAPTRADVGLPGPGPPNQGPTTIVAVPVGDVTRVEVGSEERTGPPTACLEHLEVLDTVCVDRPGPAVTLPA